MALMIRRRLKKIPKSDKDYTAIGQRPRSPPPAVEKTPRPFVSGNALIEFLAFI